MCVIMAEDQCPHMARLPFSPTLSPCCSPGWAPGWAPVCLAVSEAGGRVPECGLPRHPLPLQVWPVQRGGDPLYVLRHQDPAWRRGCVYQQCRTGPLWAAALREDRRLEEHDRCEWGINMCDGGCLQVHLYRLTCQLFNTLSPVWFSHKSFIIASTWWS